VRSQKWAGWHGVYVAVLIVVAMALDLRPLIAGSVVAIGNLAALLLFMPRSGPRQLWLWVLSSIALGCFIAYRALPR